MAPEQAHPDTSHPTEGSPPRVTLRSLLALLAPEFKKHRVRLLVGFMALVSVDFLQLTIPRILKFGIDSLSDETATSELLLRLGAIIVLIALMIVALRFVWRTLIIGFSRYLERGVRNRIYGHILGMDQPFFEKRSTGDIMAHTSNDLAAVQMACGMGMVAAVDALVLCVAAIGFMVAIHPTLTLMALLPMPILAISTKLLSGRLHHRFNTVQEQFSVLTEFARSTLVSVKLTKAYTLQSIQGNEFDRLGQKYVKANIQVAMVQGLLFPASTLIGNLGLLAILFYGGKLAIQDVISMGDFVAFITYLQMLIWPMMAVGWVTNLMQRGVTALRRVHNLVSSEPQLVEPEDADTTEPVREHGFRLEHLDFSYPGSSSNQLTDISFRIDSGFLGITGRTGSGKTTLCKLLVRLYPVDDDQLFYGDRDVNRLGIDRVRSNIGYVGQEPILFSDTIEANIGFGREGASKSDIERAARDAGIHDEILEFSDGYESEIGERGVTLSGGQRQRIALARALLSNRPVLVIDDGLSAVDTDTESRILETLRNRLQARLVIIVSNRVKLLSMTDRILVIDQGRLVSDAPHAQLLDENPFYQAMYHKQMIQQGAR